MSRLTLVTGGSRGIGRFLVRSFLADTDVLNISREPAHGAPRNTRDQVHELHNLSLDLRDVDNIERHVVRWFDEHPGYAVETLVNNAAVPCLGWLDGLSPARVEHAFRVNVQAPIAVTAAVFGAGRFSERAARVVYVTSSLGRPAPELSFAGLGLYSVTKAAVGRLALVQAREFELSAPHIGVARVHPGIVDTDLQRELRRNPELDPAFAAKSAGLPPYREGEWSGRSPKDHMRTISPELAAEFVVWVARSPEVHPAEYDFYHEEDFHLARAARWERALAGGAVGRS
ncbi:SDR family NAD(P)-dependent oxidoreductase [Pseudonocardia acaciae]|uniref:SDR family NAD(P)-dependent oxidoreductase n=1 Tax=Pseudonocardia acaciae TaxID=551276 RepID=UPI00048BFAC4|nr:SDR family NAD(P)-dependent oxidoreductase [Pseudonocardia acaciae]